MDLVHDRDTDRIEKISGLLDEVKQLRAERERLQGELTAATAEIARLKRKVYFGNCKEFYGSPEGGKS